MCSQAKKTKLEENNNEVHQMEVEEDSDPMAMLNNPVTMLNEYAQKKKVLFPIYRLVSELGEPHSRIFCMQCIFMTFETEGTDNTKQEAKKKAAEQMVYLLVSKQFLPRPRESKVPVPMPAGRERAAVTNPVGWLQEHCLKNMWKIPMYEDLGIIDGLFHCRCKCNNLATTGSGFRKQVAKTYAAENMMHLVMNGNNTNHGSPTHIHKPDGENTLPRSLLKTQNGEIDAVDSDSVDSFFQETVEQTGDEDIQECKYSVNFLHELLSASKIAKPEYEYDRDGSGGFTCTCRVVTLEANGAGRSKVVAKIEASDRMVRKIFTNAKIGDTDDWSYQKNKVMKYLHELQVIEYGGLETEEKNKRDEIVKKWLEERKQFPSAKVKPKKGVDCREQHLYFKNLRGPCVNKLRNCTGEEMENLIAQGMDFLNRLAREQNFIFRQIIIPTGDTEQGIILSMDSDIPVSFYGNHKNLREAEAKSIRNCFETLNALLQ